jgi:hypothetical protein
MAKHRLRAPHAQGDYSFYVRLKDEHQIEELSLAASHLGWPGNGPLLHLLASAYLKANGVKQ